MIRNLLFVAVVLLLLLAGWRLIQRIEREAAVNATVLFDSDVPLGEGSEVVEKSLVIGRVTNVVREEGRTAVSIAIQKDYGNRLLADSLFSIEGEGDSARLRVMNMLAFGEPVRDGAVMRAREEKISGWISRHGPAVGAFLRDVEQRAEKIVHDYDSETFNRELERWKEKLPEWKREGDEVLGRNLETLKEKVAEMERKLREAKKDAEADDLKARFQKWIEQQK
ncbi:MAG TPA: hypothetical protein VMT00_12925 [Thermoanaerobaculia bacterium]|nr:hypothetical protein [Thermoanaerobaculia bacterium]